MKAFRLSEIDRSRGILAFVTCSGFASKEGVEAMERIFAKQETQLGRRLATALDNAPNDAARSAIEKSMRRLGELP